MASTKAYTSQIVCIIMLALVLSKDSKKFDARNAQIIESLSQLPELIKQVLEQDERVKEIAKTLQNDPAMMIMGRGVHVASAYEAALKVKTIVGAHGELVII